jgi:hypothetical protein
VWRKQGIVFRTSGQFPWMASHAAVPVPHLIDARRLRIYFGPRDEAGRTRTAFLDVDPDEPSRVLGLHDRPALDLGERGTFDDSGAMPSCLVAQDGALYLFYIGWNRSVTVPYRNAIGLAVSTDGGTSFTRVHHGPVLDRSQLEPYFVTTPFVRYESGTWRMWYASATGWVDDPPNPVYVIKYAESVNGVDWRRENVTCIEPKSANEANGRPWVERIGDSYLMWYSYRGVHRFRNDPAESYRIGYAESADGVRWERKDEQVGISPSESGWDSEMLAYPAVYEHRGIRHLLYNGNGFGRSGIGHAIAGDLSGTFV